MGLYLFEDITLEPPKIKLFETVKQQGLILPFVIRPVCFIAKG